MKKLITGLLLTVLLAGCKPTEKNYEAAYAKASEAARIKSEAEVTSVTGAKLESIDGPRVEKVDNGNVMMGRGRLKTMEGDDNPQRGTMGIAIAKYSMPTNARRHLEDVKKEYPEAFIATDGQDGYYVMIRRVVALPEAAEPIEFFQTTHPDHKYMGLSGDSPVVYIVNPK